MDNKDTPSLHVHYWPEGTWCLAEDVWEYSYMSDDYTIIELPDTMNTDEIDNHVHKLIEGELI